MYYDFSSLKVNVFGSNYFLLILTNQLYSILISIGKETRIGKIAMSIASASSRPSRRIKTGSNKNVREAYLQYVKNNNNFTMIPKARSISNLANYEPSVTSSSSYLEDQYSLVKQILNATSALEKLENPSRDSSRGKAFGAPAYKSQEEYYEEVMGLKRKLKNMEENETILKAKLEHYETELNKKVHEFEAMFNSQSDINDGVKPVSNSKTTARQISSLKIKIFKLELEFKKKENELFKLQSDLKTTNNRELRIINENLKQEILRLNECLISSNASSQMLINTRLRQDTPIDTDPKTIRDVEEQMKSEYEHQLTILKDLNAKLKLDNDKLNKELSAAHKLDKGPVHDHILKKQIENLSEAQRHYKKLCNEKDKQLEKLKEKLDILKGKTKNSHKSDGTSFKSNEDLDDDDQLLSKFDKKIETLNADAVGTIQNVLRAHSQRINFIESLKKSPKNESPSSSRPSSATKLDDSKLLNSLEKKLELSNAVKTIQSVSRAHTQRLNFIENKTETSATTMHNSASTLPQNRRSKSPANRELSSFGQEQRSSSRQSSHMNEDDYIYVD